MEGRVTRFAALDLSGVSAPPVVVPPDFEAILGARKADVVARLSAIDPALAQEIAAILTLESEPLSKDLEAGAYREILHYARVNDAARAVMLAFAVGGDLDRLGDYYGVLRLVVIPADVAAGTAAVMEDDERYRRRIQLAPEALSVAGPPGAYVFHALTASTDVLDAAAVRQPGGVVQVFIVARSSGYVPSADLLSTVAARFRDDALVPLTDVPMVLPCRLADFTVHARLRIGRGPDPGAVRAAAAASLEAYLGRRRGIGLDVPLSAISAALHVAPVGKVSLMAPAADVVPGAGGLARATAVTIEAEVAG